MLMALPARLRDAWNFARQRQLAETDSAQRKPADKRARSTAQLAPVVSLNFEPWRTVRLDDQ
jgi:hypothetical protein